MCKYTFCFDHHKVSTHLLDKMICRTNGIPFAHADPTELEVAMSRNVATHNMIERTLFCTAQRLVRTGSNTHAPSSRATRTRPHAPGFSRRGQAERGSRVNKRGLPGQPRASRRGLQSHSDVPCRFMNRWFHNRQLLRKNNICGLYQSRVIKLANFATAYFVSSMNESEK